jgi:RNA polymerase sigma-70 factor (ECF subfamily)
MASNEQELENIKKGNLNSFKQLFDNYYVMLCNIANGYLNNKQLAEEVVDDVFFKIWENRETLIIHTSIRAYLIKAVYYRSLNCLEQIMTERNILYDTPPELCREDFLYVNYDTPLSGLITHELEDAINDAIESLPDGCREIFRLSRYDNLKYEEIAQRQNISVNTVKTQMKVALQKLRQKLSPYLALLFILLIASFLI